VNSASATAAIPVILVLLTALLALSLGAIVRAEPWVPAPAEPEPAGQFSQPEHAGDPPTAPLPRRIAGESGRVAGESGRIARGSGEPTLLPGVIGRAGVSGGPPWGPAPKPRGLR
jgi:hypothetical protein